MNFANERRDSTRTDRSSDWVITAHALAARAGCEQAITPMLSQILETRRETLNIAVIGGPNSGKSSRINALLDRKVLPVSGLASSCTFSIQPTRIGEDERFINTTGASGPLTDLASAIDADLTNPKGYQVHVASHWLGAESIQLLEKPALDATDDELYTLTEECLRGVDLVILLIDALMPIKRSDFKFMGACAERTLPLVVALSKADKVPDDEREVVMAYVLKHVESSEAGIPVIDTRISPLQTSGIDELRHTVKRCLAQADLVAIRREEVRHALQTAITFIMAAAQAGAEAQAKSQAELAREIKERQRQIETMGLEWMKLEQAMHQKRQSLDEQIRDFLEENQHVVLERLFYDLERNNDIKVWWQRDLPFRLQREVQSLAGQLSASINKGISSDLKWLREELLRRPEFPLQALAEPAFSVGESELIQKGLPLSDSHLFTIIARLGTAATVLAAGFLATAGGGGIALAASMLAGLTAEHVALYNARTDRSIVRDEIQKLIQQASYSYATDVSRKLRAGYDEILSSLKQHQESWQQAQLQSVMAYAQKTSATSGFNSQELLREINTLNDEIKTGAPC